jgi:hypothetical protein
VEEDHRRGHSTSFPVSREARSLLKATALDLGGSGEPSRQRLRHEGAGSETLPNKRKNLM